MPLTCVKKTSHFGRFAYLLTFPLSPWEVGSNRRAGHFNSTPCRTKRHHGYHKKQNNCVQRCVEGHVEMRLTVSDVVSQVQFVLSRAVIRGWLHEASSVRFHVQFTANFRCDLVSSVALTERTLKQICDVLQIAPANRTLNCSCNQSLKVRLHGTFFMCVFKSVKPFDAEACDIGGNASATNGLSDMKTPSKTHRDIDPLGAGPSTRTKMLTIWWQSGLQSNYKSIFLKCVYKCL
jgi:hypothetical protein